MGKKKSRIPASPAPDREPRQSGSTPVAPLSPEDSLRWPEEFGPWRRALFLAGAAAALALMVFTAASVGGLTAVKIMLASLIGAADPGQVSPANFDLATVTWGLGAVVLTGLIHPALGIGLIVLGRSWLDGYTFPLDNIYFTWAIYLLCLVWLVRTLRKREDFQMPAPALMLAALLVWLYATARFSTQYYATSQMLWLWLGYGVLFVMCLNFTRNPRVSGTLLAVFLAALFLQAAFSILHFEFLLPFLRKAVQNPAILRRYFHTDVISPEMARRFMVNRAFGTMLFPNALAAYLLLGLPLVLFLLGPCCRTCMDVLKRGPVRQGSPESVAERFVMMGIAVGVGIGIFMGIHAIAHFPLEYRDKTLVPPLLLRTVPLVILSLAGGCAAGAGTLYLLMRWGLRQWAVVMRFAAMVLLVPVLVYTLWITYSRGAYIAFLAALVWAGIVYRLKPDFPDRIARMVPWRRAAACTIVLLLLISLGAVLVAVGLPGVSSAQESNATAIPAPPAAPATPAAVPPRPVVREEGIDLSASDLADPASFRLRLGYWQVGLKMALDNLATGVGLGNFAINYPRYQFIGAGDVREAHNGFLQFFSETGLIGGGLFLAFWAWLALWGAARIAREQDRLEKLYLLAIYTGLVAFCLHAFVDINFSHPSLMVFAMVWAGLFYGRAMTAAGVNTSMPENGPAKRLNYKTLCFVILIAVFLVKATTLSAQIYRQQLALNGMRFINLSCEEELNQRMRAGLFFLKDVARFASLRDSGKQPKEAPRLPLSLARLVVDDMEALAAGSAFYKPVPEAPGRFVRLSGDEAVPDNALVAVYKPWMMHKTAAKSAIKWVRELEAQDRRYPHWPILALHIAKWYEAYLFNVWQSEFQKQRPEWIANYMRWSETMVRRNPSHADMRMLYGNALMWQAMSVPGVDTVTLAAKSEAEFDEMIRLSPIFPQHRYAYAGAMNRIARYYESVGKSELAAAYAEKERDMVAQAEALILERQKSGLYP